jgi:hypothetical protein
MIGSDDNDDDDDFLAKVTIFIQDFSEAWYT